MLHSLSEEIQLCYREAEECARRAGAAPTEALRADYLRGEQSWLRLALSYEFQQRLALFINENNRRRKGASWGIAFANDVGLPTGQTPAKVPAVGQTSKNSKHLHTQLITIIDDDSCMREGLSTLIESYGRKAATFASAEDYLASDEQKNAACLILDVHLPGMSGPDLQTHLTAAGRCPPIVFVTGQPDETTRKRVIAAGARGYLSKPCNESALLDCLEKALGTTLLVK